MSGHAGLVDLILHPQDQAYTVHAAAELMDSTGFRITGFARPSKYDPMPMLSHDALRAAVEKMSWLEQAAFTEHP